MAEVKQYKYKGNYYNVIGETKFKHPENRDWIDAVLYSPVVGNEVVIYCREKVEFYKLFEKN